MLDDKKIIYKSGNGKVDIYVVYYYHLDEISAIVNYVDNGNINTIEKFTYHYSEQQLDCLSSECPNSIDIIPLITKYRNLLIGE